MPEGIPCGSAIQSGSSLTTAASRSVTVSRVEDGTAGEHFEQYAAEAPDVGTFLNDLPSCLFG